MTKLQRIELADGSYVEWSNDLGAPALVVSDGTRTSGVYPASGGIGVYDGSNTATLNVVQVGRGTTQTEIEDPGDAGAIPVTKSGYCSIVTAGAETRTLAAPLFAGQRITLTLKTDGGDAVVTVATGINQTGNNTVTMNDAGDTLSLVGVEVGSNKRWRTLHNDGCTLSTV